VTPVFITRLLDADGRLLEDHTAMARCLPPAFKTAAFGARFSDDQF
jgi:hypothetical protein